MKQTDKAAHEATSAIFDALNYSSGQIADVLKISAKAAQQKKTLYKYSKFTKEDLSAALAFLEAQKSTIAGILNNYHLETKKAGKNDSSGPPEKHKKTIFNPDR